MATIPVQTAATAGADLTTTAAAAGGDEYANSGREMLVVTNGDASPITVTFTAQRACDLGETHDSGPHTVAAGATRYFAAKDSGIFNNDNGRVEVEYSAVANVTVGVIRGA